ncbi:MAG: GNAT family N-acetyltransferase [Nocardioides sp.]|nr:GNAT family N-acetyltransferase [Nocardioides sp.]
MLLTNVAVHPSLQRSGLGRRLLALAEERALAAGKPVIRLYTNVVMVENQRIYEHLGYVETGREAVEIGGTAPASIVRIFYEKRLRR